MMAPRPSRSTWCTGMEVVPSTTVISTETLSSVAKWLVPWASATVLGRRQVTMVW